MYPPETLVLVSECRGSRALVVPPLGYINPFTRRNVMKLFVVAVFSLALCWGLQKWVDISTQAFSLAGVSFSWTMVLFCAGLIIGYKAVKR